MGLEPTTYGVPVSRAAVRTLGRFSCVVAAAWLWLFWARKRPPCPARCPSALHARSRVREPRADWWQHSIGSGDCGRGVCGGRPTAGQTSRHRRSRRVAHPSFATARTSHRPDSGAGEPAGVVGSRVAGGHHGVTRSALDAARRRAESGAQGRREQALTHERFGIAVRLVGAPASMASMRLRRGTTVIGSVGICLSLLGCSGSGDVVEAAGMTVLIGAAADSAGSALLSGELANVGGCLGVADTVVVWPHGTEVARLNPLTLYPREGHGDLGRRC